MKKALIIGLIAAILGAGLFLYLRYRKSADFEPLIKERLGKLVHDASQGLYKLEIEKLEADVLKSKLILVKAHLIPDTALYRIMELEKRAPDDVFEVTIDKLSLEQIDIPALAANGNINLNKLFIDAPAISVWHKKQAYNVPSDSARTLYQQISNDVKRIRIDTLLIRDAAFTHYNRRLNNKKMNLPKVNFIFTGLLMDSSTQFDQSRFLYAEDCRISVKDYTINTSDSLYRFTAGDLEIRTRDQLMEMRKLTLKPRLSHQDFYRRIKHQQDIFSISMEKLDFARVAWWSLLAQESFLCGKMSLHNGNMKVYNDKSRAPDPRSKRGKFPHQLLLKIPFNIQIDTINVVDMDVSYEELNPKSEQTGTLYFDDINGNITHVTNNPELIKADRNCVVDVKAVFLKHTPITARFIFDLARAKGGNFQVKARIGALNQDQLNTILIPLAMVKINQIKVKSVEADIQGNNDRGTGRVKLLYNDLNITALKNKQDSLQKKSLLSFIANNFIIKKQNPLPGKEIRIGNGVHIHEYNKSFFNLVWKSIFVAASETVGYKAK